jgi:3-hydroxyisobutyrate dehydrogenase-like beta-hydroxyacid dehydrogenase
VRLILESAAAAGLPLPLSETHCRLLEQAEAAGWGALDNSAVIKAIQAALQKQVL